MENINHQNLTPNQIAQISDGRNKKKQHSKTQAEDTAVVQDHVQYIPIDSNKLFEIISQKAVYNKALVKTPKTSIEQSVAESISLFPSEEEFEDGFNMIYSETKKIFGNLISEPAIETIAQDAYLAQLGS